jgi:hypothetical protein
VSRSLLAVIVITLLVVGAVLAYQTSRTGDLQVQQDAHAPKMP